MGSAVPFDPGIAVKFLCFTLLIASAISPVSAARCRREQCDAAFERERGTGTSGPRVASPRYCTALANFRRCLRETFRQCLGDLLYHSHLLIAKRMLASLSCDAVLRRGGGTLSTPAPVATTVPAVRSSTPPYSHQPSTTVPPLCTGMDSYSLGQCRTPDPVGESVFCALFGDPHVRTYDGRYQTCRASGAWPLIDNSYLTVQVTNVPVAAGGSGPGTPTVPSLITVIVKAVDGCTDQLTYHASADDLPATFVDGTRQSSRTDPAITVHVVQTRHHVRVRLRHINTTLVLRRTSDGQLTFAARLPAVVAEGGHGQMCAQGCPLSQQIAVGRRLQVPRAEGRGRGRVSRDRQLELVRQVCLRHGLADFYLDACVFDAVFGGGRVAGYARSAQLAQLDLQQLAPLAAARLEGRTQLEALSPTEAAESAASPSASFNMLSLCFTFSLFINR